MSPDFRAAYSDNSGYGAPAKLPLTDTIRLRANWGDRIVTLLAASGAILIVAGIAVLMSMA